MSLTLLERNLVPRDGILRAGPPPARDLLSIDVVVAAERVVVAFLERRLIVVITQVDRKVRFFV